MCQNACKESLKWENGTLEKDSIRMATLERDSNRMATLELRVGVKAHRQLLLGDDSVYCHLGNHCIPVSLHKTLQRRVGLKCARPTFTAAF